ncbi:MAG: hypothetical protein LBC42_00120 [Puniceicoccales bacterium]|jgi:hypothetical protein|nr:hypothetical protein [Puniceicoccales bacterium]
MTSPIASVHRVSFRDVLLAGHKTLPVVGMEHLPRVKILSPFAYYALCDTVSLSFLGSFASGLPQLPKQISPWQHACFAHAFELYEQFAKEKNVADELNFQEFAVSLPQEILRFLRNDEFVRNELDGKSPEAMRVFYLRNADKFLFLRKYLRDLVAKRLLSIIAFTMQAAAQEEIHQLDTNQARFLGKGTFGKVYALNESDGNGSALKQYDLAKKNVQSKVVRSCASSRWGIYLQSLGAPPTLVAARPAILNGRVSIAMPVLSAVDDSNIICCRRRVPWDGVNQFLRNELKKVRKGQSFLIINDYALEKKWETFLLCNGRITYPPHTARDDKLKCGKICGSYYCNADVAENHLGLIPNSPFGKMSIVDCPYSFPGNLRFWHQPYVEDGYIYYGGTLNGDTRIHGSQLRFPIFPSALGGKLLRRLTWVQLSDRITVPLDRKTISNVIIDQNSGHAIGIDNDDTWTDDDKINGLYLPVIDEEMLRIVHIINGKVAASLLRRNGLSEVQLRSMQSRILSLKEHCEMLEKTGKIIAVDEWKDQGLDVARRSYLRYVVKRFLNPKPWCPLRKEHHDAIGLRIASEEAACYLNDIVTVFD